MAGSVVMTSTALDAGIIQYTLDWTSDALGAVSGNSVTLPHGTIVAVTFIPDGGATAPTDAYDLVMTCDEHAVNVLEDGAGVSIGANLSGTLSAHKVPFIGGNTVSYVRQWLHGGGYTLGVTNAGATKGGTVDIYIVSGLV